MLTYKTIVIGVDFSPLSQVALRAAVDVAEWTRAERLHLVHVLAHAPVWPVAPFSYSDEALDVAWDSASKLAEQQLAGIEVPPTRARVTRATRIGAPARELAEEALQVRADLMIVASHHRNLVSRIVVGSVASALLRAAHCPVLVVGEDRPATRPFKAVLAAVDLSPISQRVLAHAMSMAAHDKGTLHVLSLAEAPMLPRLTHPEQGDELVGKQEALVKQLVDRVRLPGIEVTVDVMVKSPVHNVVLEVAQLIESDLIVLGTSGHNAWHRFFLGSTATRVVSEAVCPVLVVPHELEEAKDRAADPNRETEAEGVGLLDEAAAPVA